MFYQIITYLNNFFLDYLRISGIFKKRFERRLKMAKKIDNLKMIGKWAFIIGLLIAIVAAFTTGYADQIMIALFILGLIVGLLNISEKDSTSFLIAIIGLGLSAGSAVAAIAVMNLQVGTYINTILGNIISFISAAALVVSLKLVYQTGKN
jgi:hypothetical protein